MSDDKLLGMIRSYLRGMGLNKTVNALEEEAEAKDVRLQPDR